jgi:signal transduction histidine kinase
MKNFFQSVLKHIDKLDATKLREQYRLVTEEVAFFEMVFNAMTEGAVLYNLEGEIVYRNPAAEAIGEIEVPLGKASKFEMAVTYPDERTLEIQTIPFERGTLAMIRDVSAERARTAEELERGATKSVCDLAAGVAHEIGNPLNAISLNLQMLERDPTDKEAIEICQSQVRRLDGIIRGFLGALRPVKPNLAPGSIVEPLKNCLAALKGQFEERRVAVTLDIRSAIPPVALDKDKMEQVFFNLLKNALEAMKDGGSINIDIATDDGDVSVAFRDSGYGMNAEQLAHLFEPYRTTKEHGTGLGLMISARIVREHGGTISAESKVGEGTTFTVKLPRLERRVRALK